MRRDDLKRKIAEVLNAGEIHGYEIQKKLASRGFQPHLSYLYRVLAEMEREKYIESTRVKSSLGPERKVYRLSKKGSEELDQELREAVKTVHVRYMEYLEKLPPQKSIIRRLQRLLDTQVASGDTILVVAPRVFYDWMVSSVCEKFNGAKVYLIKPKPAKVNTECENLVVFDTQAENILLKDNSIDVVRVHGEPNNVQKALEEFYRVLKKNGRLTMVIPYFHPVEERRHLTVGEFVEKVEHDLSEDQAKIDCTTMKALLLHYFRNVTSFRLAHLAILAAKGKK